jgi:glycerol kinase
MKKFILSMDQGTTSSKAFLIDRSGRMLGQSGYPIKQYYPKPGWVEHDPIDIWESQRSACVDVMAKTGVKAGDIEGIGITNQRETTIVWERDTGRPITNAIVWQCRRTSELCEALKRNGKGESVREKTGLTADAYFSGTKVQWILENIPEAFYRARNGDLCFGTIDTWLVYMLTGGKLHVTDFSNASRTMLYNIHSLEWDPEILSWLGVPGAMLPDVRNSSEVYGETIAEIFGGPPIPIAGIAGDQQAALFGQGCFEKGSVKNTYGTGSFVVSNIGDKPILSRSGLVTSLGWGLGNQPTYVLEGSIFIAGAAVQWLRDEIGLIKDAGEIESLAGKVADNGGVYFLPAFVGMGAPHWDMYARGTMCGITRGTSAAHIARAVIESMAYQTRDVIVCMERDSGCVLTQLRVDGGAAKNNLLMQFQSDILGIPVVRPRNFETTALGAGYLAGLATGFWKDLAEISRLGTETELFTPNMPETERDGHYQTWLKLVEMAKLWGKP